MFPSGSLNQAAFIVARDVHVSLAGHIGKIVVLEGHTLLLEGAHRAVHVVHGPGGGRRLVGPGIFRSYTRTEELPLLQVSTPASRLGPVMSPSLS